MIKTITSIVQESQWFCKEFAKKWSKSIVFMSKSIMYLLLLAISLWLKVNISGKYAEVNDISYTFSYTVVL